MNKKYTARASGKHQQLLFYKSIAEKIREIEGVVEVFPLLFFETKYKKPLIKIKGFESLTNSYLVDVQKNCFCKKYFIRVKERKKSIEERIESLI